MGLFLRGLACVGSLETATLAALTGGSRISFTADQRRRLAVVAMKFRTVRGYFVARSWAHSSAPSTLPPLA